MASTDGTGTPQPVGADDVTWVTDIAGVQYVSWDGRVWRLDRDADAWIEVDTDHADLFDAGKTVIWRVTPDDSP